MIRTTSPFPSPVVSVKKAFEPGGTVRTASPPGTPLTGELNE